MPVIHGKSSDPHLCEQENNLFEFTAPWTLSTFAHFCFFEEKSKSVSNVPQYDPYGTQTPWVGQKNSGGFMGVDPIKDPCQVCVNHRHTENGPILHTSPATPAVGRKVPTSTLPHDHTLRAYPSATARKLCDDDPPQVTP